jgi:hypothetical protein
VRDDVSEVPARPSDPVAEEAARAAELSRAAREAVRQPADPRIDRQLARMGLAPDDAPVEAGDPRGPARPVRAEELEAARADAAASSAALSDARTRLGRLTWIAALEAIAIVALVILLLVR